MVLFVVGILLVSSLVLAQEQEEIYSGFGRLVDDVRMFFALGDNRVMLASEIREKEVYSALVNNGRDEEAMSDNLENAWKKLQVVQQKVSSDTAEEVKRSSIEVRERIMEKENLPKDFEVYALEEEKTGLTAEWVIEVDGKEGQTLEREVEVVIGGDNGEQNRVMEIEREIERVNTEIKEWVVDHPPMDVDKDDGLTRVIVDKIVEEDGDDGLSVVVKKDVAGGDVVDNGGGGGNVIDDDSMCEEGEENCNNDVAPGPQGIVGREVNEPRGNSASSDSVDNFEEGDSDSNLDGGSVESSGGSLEEDSESGSEDGGDDFSGDGESDSDDGGVGITGDAVGNFEDGESFLAKLLKRIFWK